MKLNHVNLVVSDVAEATQFFATCFDFTIEQVKGDHIISILKGTDGFTLVLMGDKEGVPAYPKAFHIGFMQDSMDAVNTIYEKLKALGIEVGDEPRKIRDSFGFYFNFQNVMIEVGY